jgi:hypothetical protein
VTLSGKFNADTTVHGEPDPSASMTSTLQLGHLIHIARPLCTVEPLLPRQYQVNRGSFPRLSFLMSFGSVDR